MTGRGPFYDFEEVKVRAARWIERTIEDGLKGEAHGRRVESGGRSVEALRWICGGARVDRGGCLQDGDGDTWERGSTIPLSGRKEALPLMTAVEAVHPPPVEAQQIAATAVLCHQSWTPVGREKRRGHRRRNQPR